MIDDVLDANALVAKARADTGLDDLGEDSWQEGLERLLDSLRTEARLSEVGVHIAAAMIVGDLSLIHI